jgi:DNA-binding response OmpR family regulator
VAAELGEVLSAEPVNVLYCADTRDALALLERSAPDAVLVGPFPGPFSTPDFLRSVRLSDRALPIAVGAPAGDAGYADRARALGATLVVQRPYRREGLVTALRSLLGGHTGHTGPSAVLGPIELGRLRIEGTAPEFLLDGRPVPVPPTEFLLLRYLAERVGAVVPRHELVRAAWGDAAVRGNTLNVHIMRLRKRLEDGGPRARWITTVHGIGYRFTVPGAGGE